MARGVGYARHFVWLAPLLLTMQGCGEDDEKTPSGGISCADDTKQLCLAIKRLSEDGKTIAMDQTGGFPLPANAATLCQSQDQIVEACKGSCAKYETRDKSDNTPFAVTMLRMCLGKALILNNLYLYSQEHCEPYIRGVCSPHPDWTTSEKAAVNSDLARQDEICSSQGLIQELVDQCKINCKGNHDSFKSCVTALEDKVTESARSQTDASGIKKGAETGVTVTDAESTNVVAERATTGTSDVATPSDEQVSAVQIDDSTGDLKVARAVDAAGVSAALS